MSGIRNKNTRIEVAVSRVLFARKYRYRLNDKTLPGKPDMVFPKYRAVVFVNGCFWHMHDCHLFKWPSSNQDFWRKKINGNVERDIKNTQLLLNLGCRVAIIWECSMRGKASPGINSVADRVEQWLTNSNIPQLEVKA